METFYKSSYEHLGITPWLTQAGGQEGRRRVEERLAPLGLLLGLPGALEVHGSNLVRDPPG